MDVYVTQGVLRYSVSAGNTVNHILCLYPPRRGVGSPVSSPSSCHGSHTDDLAGCGGPHSDGGNPGGGFGLGPVFLGSGSGGGALVDAFGGGCLCSPGGGAFGGAFGGGGQLSPEGGALGGAFGGASPACLPHELLLLLPDLLAFILAIASSFLRIISA